MFLKNLWRRFKGGFPVGRLKRNVPNGTALPAGVYWQPGDASAKTLVTGQGWLLTTNLTDGSAGDTTTRETSSGATISVAEVFSANTAVASWPIAAKFKGTLTATYYTYQNGTFTSQADTGLGWTPNGNYEDQTYEALFIGAPSRPAVMATLTEDDTSGGNTSVSDFRPSA